MTTTANKCLAITRKGQQCSAYALADSAYCFFHDPTRLAQRKQARTAGGVARHGRAVQSNTKPREIKSVGDVLALLSETVGDVLLLENSLARAQTISRLAMSMLKAFEVSELETRLANIEQALNLRGQ